MKNDIDALLNALFPNGRLQPGPSARSRAAQDAQDFLDRVEKGQKGTSGALDRSLTDLSRAQAEAEQSLKEMWRVLAEDGIAPEETAPAAKEEPKKEKKAGEEPPPADTAEAFRKARESVGEEIIGQDAFLNALFTAFRRPGITGTPEDRPAAVIVVSGRDGTGRHRTARAFSRRTCTPRSNRAATCCCSKTRSAAIRPLCRCSRASRRRGCSGFPAGTRCKREC